MRTRNTSIIHYIVSSSRRWAKSILFVVLAGLFVIATSYAGINEWTSNGPEGGLVYSLAIDPTSPSVIYAGTKGGVFKSTNGGNTWSPMNKGLTGTYVDTVTVSALAIDPKTPSVIYAATYYNGVFKSTNGGSEWAVTGLVGYVVNALAIDPETPSVIYAATTYGAYKSSDGGSTWSPINSGLPGTEVYTLAIDPRTPSVIYAGTQGNPYGDGWCL